MQKYRIALMFVMLHTIPSLGAAAGAGAEVERKEAAAKWITPIYEAQSGGIACRNVQLVLRERSGNRLCYKVCINGYKTKDANELDKFLEPFKDVAIALPTPSRDLCVSVAPESPRTGSRIGFLCNRVQELHQVRRSENNDPRFVLLFEFPCPDLVLGSICLDRKKFYIDLVKNKTEVGPKILAYVRYSAQEEEALYKELAGIVPQFLGAHVAPIVCRHLIGDEAYEEVHKKLAASKPDGSGVGPGAGAGAQ